MKVLDFAESAGHLRATARVAELRWISVVLRRMFCNQKPTKISQVSETNVQKEVKPPAFTAL